MCPALRNLCCHIPDRRCVLIQRMNLIEGWRIVKIFQKKKKGSTISTGNFVYWSCSSLISFWSFVITIIFISRERIMRLVVIRNFGMIVHGLPFSSSLLHSTPLWLFFLWMSNLFSFKFDFHFLHYLHTGNRISNKVYNFCSLSLRDSFIFYEYVNPFAARFAIPNWKANRVL